MKKIAAMVLAGVLAAKRFGGKVIAQVKRVVQTGTLNPKSVTVPGVFIDGIVVCENPDVDHRQTSSWINLRRVRLRMRASSSSK